MTKAAAPHFSVSISASFANVTSLVLALFVVLISLGILPLGENMIDSSKSLYTVGAGIVVVGLIAVRLGVQRKITLLKSPFGWLLAGLSGLTLVSAIINSQFPMSQLVGTTGVWLAGPIMALAAGSLLASRKRSLTTNAALSEVMLVKSLIVSTTILVVLQLAQLLTSFSLAELLGNIYGLQLESSIAVTPTGSQLLSLQLFVLTLAAMVGYWWQDKAARAKWLLAAPIALIGVVTSLWLMLPGKPATPTILPFMANWSVALNALQTPRVALVGVGADNFGLAFQQLRPAWMNLTPTWNVVYTQGSTTPSTLLVSLGLSGFLLWVSLLVTAWKWFLAKPYRQTAAGWATLAGLTLQLLLPPHAVVIGLTFVALAYWMADQSKSHEVVFKSVSAQHVPGQISVQLSTAASVVSIAVILGLGWIGYWTGRNSLSQYWMLRAVAAQQANNMLDTYESYQRAVALNPYDDTTRSRYGATSLLIAQALSQKESPTEADTQQVATLAEQALREAQVATTLQPAQSQHWQLQASVYQNLIGVAEGADQWAINSYARAIETAPTNPLVRMSLAALFQQYESYQQAASLYDQAIQLKPDLAAPRYQLAQILKQGNNPVAAYQQLSAVLELLPEDSTDRTTVQGELDLLKPEVEKAQAEAQAAAQQSQPSQQPTQPAEPAQKNLIEETLPIEPVSPTDTLESSTGEEQGEFVLPSPEPTTEPETGNTL